MTVHIKKDPADDGTPVKSREDIDLALSGATLPLLDLAFDAVHLPQEKRDRICEEIVDCGKPLQTSRCVKVTEIKTDRFGNITIKGKSFGADILLFGSGLTPEQLAEIRRAMSGDLRLRIEAFAKAGPTGSALDITVVNKDNLDCAV